MAIRLETAARTGIDNHQEAELSAFHLNWARDIGRQHPAAKPRTEPSAKYNCHGLTFASRRTSIEKASGIRTILLDDAYAEVPIAEAMPGDIVIYSSDTGDLNHSGIVVECGQHILVPIVCSKWGSAGEFVHGLKDCPNLYGPNVTFYRCRR
jgi:hypothetical protein